MSGIAIIVALRVEVSGLGVLCPNVKQDVQTDLRGAWFVAGVGTATTGGAVALRIAAATTPLIATTTMGSDPAGPSLDFLFPWSLV